MTEALIVQGGGRDHTPEEDVAAVRTVLRIQLSDEQRGRIGISADRDLALCVNRVCDALSEAEEKAATLKKLTFFWYSHESPGYMTRFSRIMSDIRESLGLPYGQKPPLEWAGEPVPCRFCGNELADPALCDCRQAREARL